MLLSTYFYVRYLRKQSMNFFIGEKSYKDAFAYTYRENNNNAPKGGENWLFPLEFRF